MPNLMTERKRERDHKLTSDFRLKLLYIKFVKNY